MLDQQPLISPIQEAEKLIKNQEELNALEALEKELIYLNKTPMGRRAFLNTVPFLLTACATVPQTRHREGDNTGQKSSLTVAQEQQMTKEYISKIRQEYPIIRSQSAQNYIQGLGQKIVSANNLRGNPYNYNFSLVEGKSINAFALPAGEVMVTAPLLAAAESEAELAGVVGHEIGHVMARHTAERMEAQKKTQTKSLLYTIGGAVLGGLGGAVLAKSMCNKKSKTYRDCLSRARNLGLMAGGGAGALISRYAFMAHSREDEMEADRISFRTAVKAGYNKDHVGRFYNKLLEMEQKAKAQGAGNPIAMVFGDALSTHPPSQQRVAQMQEMASAQRARSGSKITSREFQNIKAAFSKRS